MHLLCPFSCIAECREVADWKQFAFSARGGKEKSLQRAREAFPWAWQVIPRSGTTDLQRAGHHRVTLCLSSHLVMDVRESGAGKELPHGQLTQSS